MGGKDGQTTIIVVCGSGDTLKVLNHIVRGQNRRVSTFPDVESALDSAPAVPPDLVLLDAPIPEITVCELIEGLRTIRGFVDVPVIVLSERADVLSKIKTLRAGAVDFITKPFVPAEVEARVEVQLQTRRAHLNLEEQCRSLREKNAELQGLVDLRDDLVHVIVHDMRSPLMGLRGGLTLLSEDLASSLGNVGQRDLDLAFQATQILEEMVSSIHDIRTLEADALPLERKECNLAHLLTHSLAKLGAVASRCRIEVDVEQQLNAFCDPEVTGRILTTIIGNALRQTPRGGRIRISGIAGADLATVEVTDNGPRVPSELRTRIFEKSGQIESRKAGKKYSTGLGLTFCKLAVNAQGGEIGLRADSEQGNTYWFRLPVAPAQIDGNGHCSAVGQGYRDLKQ